jgi:hypothetical protein
MLLLSPLFLTCLLCSNTLLLYPLLLSARQQAPLSYLSSLSPCPRERDVGNSKK